MPGRLHATARKSPGASPSSVWPIAPRPLPTNNRRTALEEDCELELRYHDYSEACREAGVEPLTFEALQHFIEALTETPKPTVH